MNWTEPAIGPVREWPSLEAMRAHYDSVDTAIKLLQNEGYTILDSRGRPLA